MKSTRILPGAALALALLACGAASAGVPGTSETAQGKVLVDAAGMTLYVFDKDTPGASNCYDMCEKNWPVLKADASARPEGEFDVIVRANGDRQWTYKGRPLYRWVKDMKPGDITGDGVNGVWHLAKP